jgi:glutamyl-Q tRNA(Asp) synthetase
LDAAGLHWDGPEFHQSSRVKAYAEGLERLSRDGLVYPCTCSRKDLAQEAGSPAVYPGLCRSRKPGSVRGPHALRVRIPASLVGFEDRLQGQQTQNLETEVGDLILFRRDRVHAYHLATVLDDAEQGVTEVLRGIDLMDSTPRQIYLQERLGLPATTFAHLPILLDRAGHKLGKSSLAPAVATRNPGTLLFRLLELLKQEPPAELKNAPPREILDWAIAHWDLMRLAGLRAVAADPADFDELVPNEADSSGH